MFKEPVEVFETVKTCISYLPLTALPTKLCDLGLPTAIEIESQEEQDDEAKQTSSTKWTLYQTHLEHP